MFSLSNGQARRVAIYIRVSTSEQEKEGYSLEAQKKMLLDYVKFNVGLNLVASESNIYTDVHTGADLNRTALNRLREAIKAKQFDAVLVWKIDRLSRSLQHLLVIFEEMEKNQVGFISLQENLDFRGPVGKLIFQIMGAMAQFERDLIKGRTYMGRVASAEMGNFTGSQIPFGYKAVSNPGGRGKKLQILEGEKLWVEEIYHWYIYDGLGSGQIAKRLNKMRVAKGQHITRRHKFTPWTDMPVINILTNPTYRGEYIANQKDESGNMLPPDKWTIVKVPACISEITFAQAQIVRKKNKGGHSTREYMLTGKILDMTLKTPKAFIGATRTKGGFSYRRKQFDRDGVHFPVFEIPGKQLEEFVWNKIVNALENPEQFIKQYVQMRLTNKDELALLGIVLTIYGANG